MIRSRNSASRLPTLLLTLDRAFLLLFFGIVLGLHYRYHLLDAHDPYKCEALLTRGQWLDIPGETDIAPSFQDWQPPGCMMYDYKAMDISTCLKSRRIVYIGDSTTRQIFWATAKKLDAKGAKEQMTRQMTEAEKHKDQSFGKAGVALDFIWDPFFNSSRLHQELTSYRAVSPLPDGNQTRPESAAMIVIGGGLWFALHSESAPLKNFKDSVDDIVYFMKSRDSKTLTLPSSRLASGGRLFENLLLLAPVQVPLYNSLSPERSALITPEKVAAMNDYLQQLSEFEGANIVWSYLLMTSEKKVAYDEMGVHATDIIANQKADVLLNMRCNAKLAHFGEYPFDKTCCSNYRQLDRVQRLTLFLSIIVIPILVLVTAKDSRRLKSLPSRKISRALLVLALAICYCFYADRTQLFNKVQKRYNSTDFMTLSAISLVLGLLSIRRSSSRPTLRSTSPSSQEIQDQPFLSRDQTDEWKGWMQFVILIYHYTGASKILWIYVIVRLLVASYLFMTGFGHTVFFYRKGDYSLRRCASVLIRINLLSCLLPYIMRTDYLFYYFAPLITFWFTVVYITMRLGCSRNSSSFFLIGKIIVSASVVTALNRVPGVLEAIFWSLKMACQINWNVSEWRFRNLLDVYIVYIGMIAGILSIKITDAKRGRDPSHGLDIVRKYFSALRLFSIVLAVVVLPGFWFLTRRSPDKFHYNWWQPYISFLPILSFVVLRNCSRHIRNVHSSVFAWLGRHSLETFTLQFHIWMAGDTKGLLSLGIFGRNTNFVNGRQQDFALITIIFVWVSWHVASATGTITSWVIDPSEGRADVEIEDPRGAGQESSPLDLPQTKSPTKLERRELQSTRAEAYSTRSLGGLTRLLREDLRVRLAVILGVMWLCNVATP